MQNYILNIVHPKSDALDQALDRLHSIFDPQNEVAEDGGAIILLQFKRTPEPYMTLMVDLQAKHDQCGRGFSLLTASEMTLVQRVCPHLELKPWHILVREDEEKQLIARLRQIPSRYQVKCTSRIVVVTWTSRIVVVTREL